VDYASLADALNDYYYGSENFTEEARKIYCSAPANRYSREMGSQATYYEQMDTDHAEGCIRDMDHCYFRDGDTAWSISQRYGIKMKSLYKHNGIPFGVVLHTHQRLDLR
jgi:hypothetical protein